MASQTPLKTRAVYVLPVLAVVLLAGLACAAVLTRHVLQAKNVPISAETLEQGIRQDVIESAVAIALASAVALLLTAAVLIKHRFARVTLVVLALSAAFLSPWPIQATADRAAWAHRSAVRFVPILTAWAAVPLALLVARLTRTVRNR